MNKIFSNKSLQVTHSRVERSISHHLQKLNAISNDIKQIEEILAKAALSVDYEYLFDQSSVTEKEGENSFGSYARWLQQTNHLIVWRRENKRLLYEIHDICFDTDDTKLSHPSTPFIKISKPLIECRAHIRLKIEPELDFFYQGIDSLLGQGFLEETVKESSPILIAKKRAAEVEDEIPF